MKLSKKIEQCQLSPIRKFYPYATSARERGIYIHPLNIGQPDIKTPEGYLEAIRNFTDPVLAYAQSPGMPALIKAVQNYYDKLGVHYEASEIVITTGGSEALMMAMMGILDEGCEVIVPEPYYPNYHTFISMAGGKICPIRTYPEDGYRYADRDRIVPLINEKTRAILITNPGNPTGTMLTKAEVRLLADIAKEHELFLICDEVYREFIYEGEMTTAAALQDMSEHLVMIDSVSKRFSASRLSSKAQSRSHRHVCPLPPSTKSVLRHCITWIRHTSTRFARNTAAAEILATAR